MSSMIDHATRALMTCVTDPHLRRATVYIGHHDTVKASRQRRHDGRARGQTFLVTMGSPNYAERRFIKKCQQAGEPFPVKKVQLQYWPTKR